MSSDESDDEPLSVLALAKKENPAKFAETYQSSVYVSGAEEEPDEVKKRGVLTKKHPTTVNSKRGVPNVSDPPVIERPADVWLYVKDLTPTGPYSCLLCPEWFINKSKLIVHYAINHKKDFCGICRYFVTDRDAWDAHLRFHAPWPCSQCKETFPTEADVRTHLSAAHKLVHCRVCHFRMFDDETYNTHLFQKHNVTNVANKYEPVLWEIEFEGSLKFLCLLCSKTNPAHTYFNHYMGFHHFTMRCFTNMISGNNPPFTINGADVSSHFIQGLKEHNQYGYVELKKEEIKNEKMESEDAESANEEEKQVKKEVTSDNEDSSFIESKPTKNQTLDDISSTYTGDEDFDITLVELITINKSYFDYISKSLKDINSHLVSPNTFIDYHDLKSEAAVNIVCGLCKMKFTVASAFTTHMSKMHGLKYIPLYSCRVCESTFYSQNELDHHMAEELEGFRDLFICQFCDTEFTNREATRHHLTEHWDDIHFDNCFSPHLGFKCRYCPTLFWNEMDRETHQVRVHFNKHKDQYYKCENCPNVYSDKIWFVHHYLEKHNEQPKYLVKCCLCCVVLHSIDEMRSHFGEHHQEARKIYCSLDPCMYKPLCHKKSFKLHVKTIHAPHRHSERSHSCPVCAREFPSQRACAIHMAQMHGPGKFKCKLCKDMLHTPDERKLHYLLRHPGRHPFECVDCGKSFQYKSSLYMHKQIHSPNKKQYKCTYCEKIFAKKDSYREHIQIHEGPRHACSYCPMRFVQRSNMLRHERRHTGERPYACPHCTKSFSDKGACTAHVRTHSKDTSYECVYCEKTFAQKSKLTYHIRRHTGENLETCSVCSKLFTSVCSLREHMKTHNKDRTIKCAVCERKYLDERSMLRHVRATHGRAAQTCPICNKTLTSMGGLRHHVLTHSPLNTFHCKCCTKSYAVRRTMLKHLRKRHGLKDKEHKLVDFYRRLDPRECEIKLDEETMTKVFGPPKKATSSDVRIGDFVTFPNKVDEILQKKDEDETAETDDANTEDDEGGSDDGDGKSENADGTDCSEGELEPTDFVSVKIEPVDEDTS